jgi:hypothetical protein
MGFAEPLATAMAHAAMAQPDTTWIDNLAGEIQTQIDMFSEKYLGAQTEARQKVLLGQRAANRVTFMRTMAKFLGSYNAVESHYKEIQPMPGTQLWAHISTRERLMAVQEDLKAQGSPMPETDVALGLRGDHLHPEGKSGGWYTHAAGFAIDWKAYAAPHITDARLNVLFETVTGGPTYFDLGKSPDERIRLLERMGQGKADAKESAEFLSRVEAEYNRLKAGSEKFKTDLPETSLAPLRELEKARTDVNTKTGYLTKLRKKGAKKDVVTAAADDLIVAQAAFDAKATAVEGQLKQIFEPWTRKLDAAIEKIDSEAKDKGVDLEMLTGQYGFKELNSRVAQIQRQEWPLKQTARSVLAEVMQIQRESMLVAAKVDAAKAWLASPGSRAPTPEDSARWSDALAEVETVVTQLKSDLGPLKETLKQLLPGTPVEPKPPPALRPTPVSADAVRALKAASDRWPERVKKSADRLQPVSTALIDLLGEEAVIRKDILEKQAYTESKQKEVGAKGVKELLQKKVKLLALKGAKQALETNANGFVFRARDVRNPAITQLLGLMSGTQGGGFFTPNAETGGEAAAKQGKMSGESGFNLKFFKSMVSHGFELGVAWTGSADTMHFELAEGRALLMSGGKEPLVAGATLRAAEAKKPGTP